MMKFVYTSLILLLAISFTYAKFSGSDVKLECSSKGMLVHFNKTTLDSHKQTYKIEFMDTNSSSCMVTHNTTQHLSNNTILLQANFNQCAIAVAQENENIVYKQTIVVTFGQNPKSSLVYREEKVKLQMRCEKANNLTVNLDGKFINVTAIAERKINKTRDAKFDISLIRTDSTYTTKDSSAALFLNSFMYFKIELETSRTDLSVSPQSCYAHPANNVTLKYYLIENRCPNKDDSTVKISNTDARKTVFLWQNQAFRFFGQSTDAVYVSCDVVICASNTSAACQRCGVTNNRDRRDASLDDVTDQAMQTAKVTSPLIVLVDEPLLAEPKPQYTGNIFSGTKGIAILVLCGIVSLIAIVMLVKKLMVTSSSGHQSQQI